VTVAPMAVAVVAAGSLLPGQRVQQERLVRVSS